MSEESAALIKKRRSLKSVLTDVGVVIKPLCGPIDERLTVSGDREGVMLARRELYFIFNAESLGTEP